jgi:hypothetical protein
METSPLCDEMGRKVQIVRVWVRAGSRGKRTISYYSLMKGKGKVIVMKYVGRDGIPPYTRRDKSGIIPAT